MPRHYRVLLHDQGPVLWPEHKPLQEVLDLRAHTLDEVWYGTYQGIPTAPAGTVFRKAWYRGCNRYDALDRSLIHRCVARYMAWDTADKDGPQNAFTACVIGDLLPTYHLLIREVYRSHLAFPELPEEIERMAHRPDE